MTPSIYEKLYDLIDKRLREAGRAMPCARQAFLTAAASPPSSLDLRELGGSGNLVFFETAFLCLLGRLPDAAARKHWGGMIATLPAGVFRKKLLDAILGTPVAKARHAAIVDEAGRRVPATPSGEKAPPGGGTPRAGVFRGVTRPFPTVYIDVTYVLRVAFRSGIPRVVQEVLIRLLRQGFPPLSPVFFDPERNAFRRVNPDKLLLVLECGRQDMPGLIEDARFEPEMASPGDVFFDLDAVWHLSPRRSLIYPALRAAGVRIVSYVYDIIPVTDPQRCNLQAATNFLHYLGAVLENADLILASTQSTLDESAQLCDRLGLRRRPGFVTWLGADFKMRGSGAAAGAPPHSQALQAMRAGRYVLMVGTIQPMKNQAMVLDAFERGLFQKGVNLILAGKVGWDVEALERRIRQHPLLGRQLFFLEQMDDATIDHLYRGAFCVAFATYREGFGLPTIEALQRGTPVLASDVPVLREVGGDLCRYFDPASPDSFVAALAPLLESEEAYRALREKVAGYRPVTWDAVSAKIADILEETLVPSPMWRALQKTALCLHRFAFHPLPPASDRPWGRSLSFAAADGAPAAFFAVEGFSHVEDAFTWTDGERVLLRFPGVPRRRGGLSFELRYGTFLPEERIVVAANGREIARFVARGEERKRLRIPVDCVAEDGTLSLALELPDAVSPREKGQSDDARRLALKLYSLRIN